MNYEFSKMHGAGNDFVMIEDMSDTITLSAEQVVSLCDRHFGIGADGVILVKPSPRAECAAYMDYYNSDGTKAQMCGNGVRCFAKFLVDNGIVEPESGSFIADTLAGPRPIQFSLDKEGKLALATVDMGKPILNPCDVPTTLLATDTDFGPVALEQPVSSDSSTFSFTCVSMGNPHAVTFVDNVDDFCVSLHGPNFEVHEVFPEHTNVEFAMVGEEEITMRVWERGCGETYACGTGACATAVAAHITGRCGRKTHVKLLGGTLAIDWRDDGHVYMTGPAALSFTGNVDVQCPRPSMR